MSRIFISHSCKDQDLVNFFSKVFSTSKVEAIFEEFENEKLTPEKIRNDINRSNAIFVLLSKNVTNIRHTRDWVIWESGVGNIKDIWVFEPLSQINDISVTIPFLRHFVLFDMIKEHFQYIKMIIENYDTRIISTLIKSGVGAAAGALLAKEKSKKEGAILGAIGGFLLQLPKKIKPSGIPMTCKKCDLFFNLHMPKGHSFFRCPNCNNRYLLRI